MMNAASKYQASFVGLVPPAEVSRVAEFANYLHYGNDAVREDTVRTYMGELRHFLKLRGGEGKSLAEVINRANLTQAIMSFSLDRASTRRNMFYAVKSFARYLRDLDVLDENTFTAIASQTLKSKHKPTRHFLTPEQVDVALQSLLADPDYDEMERLTNLAIFATLTFTGLRNSELCNLRLEDIDFDKGLITVRHGKGDKSRMLGLPDRLIPILQLYLENRPTSASGRFFVGLTGQPLNRDLIIKRFGRLSKKLGFKVIAHGLRRSFATHRAHAGVPLDKLQTVMGHADIKTTRMYVQTDEHSVAQEMRAW